MKRVLVLCLACAAACVRAPEIVLVDRATALEQQAGGSFEELERKLVRTGVSPRPVPLTPDELEALGMNARSVDAKDRSDAETVDALLRQRCVGEGKEGLLVDTEESCRGAPDKTELRAVVERVNRSRLQLWRWLHERSPKTPKDEIRRRWTGLHAEGVVCGGWVQRADGSWGEKAC